MSELQHLLQRHAAWQKKRESLSWPDKIRMVEAMRESLRQLRALENKSQAIRKEQQAGK